MDMRDGHLFIGMLGGCMMHQVQVPADGKGTGLMHLRYMLQLPKKSNKGTCLDYIDSQRCSLYFSLQHPMVKMPMQKATIARYEMPLHN